MAKSLKDVLKGVKSSTKVKNDLGGYKPKSGDEADFVGKHDIEKHADRVGNGDDVYQATNIKHSLSEPKEKRHGYKKPEDAKVNESKKAEDAQCNESAKGTACPVHGLAECSSSGTIREKKVNEAWTVTHKDGKTTEHDSARDALKASRNSPGSKVGATHGAMGKKAADVLGTAGKANIGSFGPWGYRPPEKKIKEAYDDNSTKVSDWSDKKLKWHASDDRKHSSSHVPAWSELRRRAKTGQNAPKPKKTNEEVEELDELSKKTLGSYVQSATRNAMSRQYALGKGDKSDTRKLMNRRKGIDKAVDKLVKEDEQIDEADALKARERLTPHIKKDEYGKQTAHKHLKTMIKSMKGKHTKPNLPEEVEELDELSKKTLASYIKTASHSAANHRAVAVKNEIGRTQSDLALKNHRVAYNRLNGINTAANKLAKEEVEIEESSAGHHHFEVEYVKRKYSGDPNTERKTHTYKVPKEFHGQTTGNIMKRIKGHPESAAAHQKHKDAGFDVSDKPIKFKSTNEETQIDEVLTKKTPAGEWIKDFKKSDNPKFAGKSADKRKQMALAAYYAKQRNEEVETLEENQVEYHLRNVNKDDKAHKKVLEAIDTHKGKFVGASNKGAIVSIHKNKVYDFLKDMKMHGITPDPMERFNEDLAVPLLGGGSDESAEMVKAELKALANKAMHLVMQMPESMHVEPWCQSKIAQAKSMVSDVHDYMIYGDHKEEDEQVDNPMDVTTASNPTNSFPNMSVDVGRNV